MTLFQQKYWTCGVFLKCLPLLTLHSSRKIPGFLFQSALFEVRVVREEKNWKFLEFEEHLDHMLLQFWTWLAFLFLQMASNVSYLKDLSFHIPNSLEILKTAFSF